tara:strand:- start:4354 stop:5997 length:1644 start_codon:yes stop_codon:yes gene_type:complete
MKITVVGSGTAGSLTSAFLAKEFPNATVEMIHSEKVGIIGVGESITPHLPGLLGGLGVDEKKFMRETDAVFKYGNNMEDWTDTPDGPDVLRMFYWSNGLDKDFTWENVTSTFPHEVKTTDVWLDVYRNGMAPDLNVYHHNAEGYQYCKDLKMPFDDNGNYLLPATATYAYHIDAEKTSPWIRKNVCSAYGVVETIAHVEKVNTNEQGITSVILDSGREVTSDIWVDCTGLSRVLIGELTKDIHTYKANKVNSAWVCPINYEDKDKEQVNYTRSIRRDMGWQFSIALTNRIGTGLVYSDEYFTDDEALEYWHSIIKGRQIREPRNLKWTPGRLKTPNVGNVFAVGMAAGFIDPLEANAVVSSISCMKRLAWMLQRDYDKDYYNRKVTYYFDDIADFTAVHYTLSRRGDNHFWQDMRRIGRELDHKGLVKKKYYEQANCMDSVVGYVTAFPDVNWLDIANNWVQDLDDWPSKSTPEQQTAYIRKIRNEKLLHEIQSSNNKKSIDSFMKMYNNVNEYDKGLNKWPSEYFGKMFGAQYMNRHEENSRKVQA